MVDTDIQKINVQSNQYTVGQRVVIFLDRLIYATTIILPLPFILLQTDVEVVKN